MRLVKMSAREIFDVSGSMFSSAVRRGYRPYADKIYAVFRVSLIHNWNLFEASIYADNSTIRMEGSTIAFGLHNFSDALVAGTENFLNSLPSDRVLFNNSRNRYEELRATAKP